MKQKLALLATFALLGMGAYAQKNGKPGVKPGLIGFQINALDFKTIDSFKDSSSNNRRITKLSEMDFGASIGYMKGITKHIDFTTRISAAFHEYAKDRGETSNKVGFGAEFEPTLVLRAFDDRSWINPYINAGVGVGYYNEKFGAFVPFGIGMQFNIMNKSYFMVQSNYRHSITRDDLKDHLAFSLGFYQKIGPDVPKVVPPPPPPVVYDRDNDGVMDSVDRCPDVFGLASLQGCPDRDGDGIADIDDKCPDVAGIAKYDGCPIPDTDGDGINDEEDKCPTVPGLARYQGCPIPDTDGDGVNDEEDKCPTRPGPVSNQGCPVIAKEVIEKINFAAKNVFYATGSFKLLPKSFKSLDEVARLMKEDASLMLDIDGHTDSQGSDASNQILSEKRANSVKEYLEKKGVESSRLKATGYGEEKPIADNKTAAGRAKNRRTEMTVRNY